MGRTYDAIRLAEAEATRRDDSPTEPGPTPRRAETEAEPATSGPSVPELPADAPYIEVGLRQLDGSPEVMAVAAPSPLARPAVTPHLQFRPTTAKSGPVAGTLPADVIAYHAPAHPLAVQYRALTTSLLGLRQGIGPRLLGFTTALAGTPLCSVLLNVGVSAARLASRRVVLIDADLRQPTLAATLGLPRSPGLVEVLSGVVAVEQAVRSTVQANLLVLPAGETTPESLDLLRVDPLRRLLQRLALRADLLLLALPRWDAKPDVLAGSVCCESLFVVAPEAEVDQPHVQQVLAQVPAVGVPLAGTVLLAA